MSDDQQLDLSQVDKAIDEAEAAGDTVKADLLREVRAENARRRIAGRELQKKFEQLQADYTALEASKTAEGDRLSQLAAELEQERKTRTSVLERLTAANKTAIEYLPEKYRALVPEGLDAVETRAWLDRAVPLLSTAPAVPLDGQDGSTKDRTDDTVAVTEDVATMAKMLKVDPQELAKRAK